MSLCGAVYHSEKRKLMSFALITLVEPLPKRAIISHVSGDPLKISPSLAMRLRRQEDT